MKWIVFNLVGFDYVALPLSVGLARLPGKIEKGWNVLIVCGQSMPFFYLFVLFNIRSTLTIDLFCLHHSFI
jgi:hypothetical protein